MEAPGTLQGELEAKTVFNVLSRLKEFDSNTSEPATPQPEIDEDILILTKDPETQQSTINKTAYLKLHRSFSPNRSNTIDKIKEKYEQPNEPETETVESLKHKYSPSGLGYNKPRPLPKPRLSRSQIITPNKKNHANARLSLNIEKNKHKDVNSNHLKDDPPSEDEFVTIVTRSDSEESVLQFQKELSAFTMDKKKRANSFRRIFSVFSNKDKKKKQEKNGESYSDNLQNETKQSPYSKSLKSNINKVQRSDSDVKVPNQYNDDVKIQINQFNQHKEAYKSNEANNTYMNMPNVRKYIDTSSSASTLASDRSNIYQNDTPKEDPVEIRSFRPSRISDGRRDTPPRLLETKQDVRLVNPKALIPINSERPYLNETYATVLDSLESRFQKPPRSPSVEPTKLKLPPNREIIALSPRIRSPIPPDNVSTEKIIATELLKPKRSPTPTKKSPSHHQRFDYPDYASRDSLMRSADNLLSSKPPIRPPSSSNDKVITNAQIHTNLSLSNQSLTMRPSNLSIRPSTPSGSQIPDSPKTTPQKEDMRKSVEAYYWKEIKKLKDQEDYEIYLLQRQYGNMLPYGYAEEPISVRRSRSMSPQANRNGRRSLSLPRENRPSNIIPEKYYPSAIPENRAVTNPIQPRSVQQLQFQQYFQRNTPERSTIDGSPYATNSLYRPIFKRGSLSTPPRQLVQEDTLKRKVSFSGTQDQNFESWPTKNGFTQSPPQRRMERVQSHGDDEVFYPTRRTDLPQEEIYYNTKQNEPMYVLRANQNSLYLHQRQAMEGTTRPQALTRHGSIQIQEELYGQRRMSHQQPQTRRPASQQGGLPMLRREIIVNDEIFGQFGGYSGPHNNVRVVAPQYATRPSIAEYNTRVRDEYYNRQPPQKQVSVSNKVCDIYGQIHDADPPRGVIMGQLQQNPGPVRNSYTQLPPGSGRDNFVRNSRLTASANDMYRRAVAPPNEALYGRIENGAPTRPLPPVPQKKGAVRNNIVSDTESGSDASEIQRILDGNARSRRRGIFGK